MKAFTALELALLHHALDTQRDMMANRPDEWDDEDEVTGNASLIARVNAELERRRG